MTVKVMGFAAPQCCLVRQSLSLRRPAPPSAATGYGAGRGAMSDWRQTPRLSGAQSPIPSVRPEWWLRSWFLNFAIGFVFGSMVIIFLEQSLTQNSPAPVAYCLGLLLAFVVLEFLLEKYMSGFETKRHWQFGGTLVALLTVMPLVITPKCGWNNDKCPPVHPRTHHAQ
jgi:hypothetical protein